MKICRTGRIEAARVSAAVALLDRGYGKPMLTMQLAPASAADLTDLELLAIIGETVQVIEHDPQEGQMPVLSADATVR